MPRAIKCDACWKFEDSTGYTVQIFKNTETVSNGDTIGSKLIFDTENICSECIQKVKDILQPDHE